MLDENSIWRFLLCSKPARRRGSIFGFHVFRSVLENGTVVCFSHSLPIVVVHQDSGYWYIQAGRHNVKGLALFQALLQTPKSFIEDFCSWSVLGLQLQQVFLGSFDIIVGLVESFQGEHIMLARFRVEPIPNGWSSPGRLPDWVGILIGVGRSSAF